MISTILLGLGLVAIVEGLVLAIAPLRLQEMLALLARLTEEQRRLAGLIAITIGVGLVWASQP